MPDAKTDISIVVEQYLCNSCGACFAACNQGAIRYSETVGGYLFPVIDTDSCIQCGLCYQVCSGVRFGKTLSRMIPQDPFTGIVQACYVGRAADNEIFLNSQSGGIATALLWHLFDSGLIDAAIVAVMVKGLPPRGGVRVVTDPDDLKSAQKSKYSPIPLLKALRQIPTGTSRVALVGLPCQMHALHNLQDVIPAYHKLFFFKIGLVCESIMTSVAIDYMGGLATNEAVDDLVWKDKRKQSYPGNPVVHTSGGREIMLKASQRIKIKDFFTPVRCRMCFDKLNIYADVTLGDPHGIKDVDRLNGESMLLVRTETGAQLVEDARQQGKLELRQIIAAEAIQGQGIAKKRLQWAGYMRAWADMDRMLPSFPFTLASSIDITRHIYWLKHGLQLDNFPSQASVLRAANNWILLCKIKFIWRWPISKIKELLGRYSRGLVK